MSFFPIIIPVAVFIILFFVLKLTVWPLVLRWRINKRLMQMGTDAEAVILDMHQTGLYVNNQPQVAIQLQVEPRMGKNFVSEVREVLSFIDISIMRAGARLNVKFNPDNHKEVMIVRGAHLNDKYGYRNRIHLNVELRKMDKEAIAHSL